MAVEYTFTPMTQADAKELCAWRYDGAYSVYDFIPYEDAARQGWSIADAAVLARCFVSAKNAQGKLCGFFRLEVQPDGAVEIGLGLAPDICGKGNGAAFVRSLTTYAQQKHPQKPLYMEVRPFNQRAVRCYEKCGYTATAQYTKQQPWGKIEYIRMEYAPL